MIGAWNVTIEYNINTFGDPSLLSAPEIGSLSLYLATRFPFSVVIVQWSFNIA